MKLTALAFLVSAEVLLSVGVSSLGIYGAMPAQERHLFGALLEKEACGPRRHPLAGWVPGTTCPKR